MPYLANLINYSVIQLFSNSKTGNMTKVLLIQTTQYSTGTHKLCKQKRIYLPGLAMPVLASLTPEHWDLEIILEVIEDINFETDADIIGIGAMGHAVFRAIDIAKEFRKRGKTVFMGGYMVSILPSFVREHTDSIIIGDAEISYPKLLSDFEETGKIEPEYHFPLNDLNNLPVPKYEVLNDKKIGYMLPVQAARGCPHTCSYCSIACIYKGKYMYRPVDDVIGDIKKVKELGYKYFYLIDDNITGNTEYLEELALKIKPLKMLWASQSTILLAKNERLLKIVADSGCRILTLGVESLSQEGLNKLNKSWVKATETEMLLKRMLKYGIIPATEMIIGTDGDTPESLHETFKMIMRVPVQVPKFYVLTPMPGTDLYEEFKNKGRLIHEDYKLYTATHAVYKPAQLTPDQLEEEYWMIYKNTYSFFNILRRTIFTKSFLKSPLVHLFAFGSNMVYRKYIKSGDAPNIF